MTDLPFIFYKCSIRQSRTKECLGIIHTWPWRTSGLRRPALKSSRVIKPVLIVTFCIHPFGLAWLPQREHGVETFHMLKLPVHSTNPLRSVFPTQLDSARVGSSAGGFYVSLHRGCAIVQNVIFIFMIPARVLLDIRWESKSMEWRITTIDLFQEIEGLQTAFPPFRNHTNLHLSISSLVRFTLPLWWEWKASVLQWHFDVIDDDAGKSGERMAGCQPDTPPPPPPSHIIPSTHPLSHRPWEKWSSAKSKKTHSSCHACRVGSRRALVRDVACLSPRCSQMF